MDYSNLEKKVLSALKDGAATHTDVIEKTGLAESVAFNILQSLIIRGLIAYRNNSYIVIERKDQGTFEFSILRVRADLGFDNFADCNIEDVRLFPASSTIAGLVGQLKKFFTERSGSIAERDLHGSSLNFSFDTKELTFYVTLSKTEGELTDEDIAELNKQLDTLS